MVQLYSYLAALVLFLIADMVWLGTMVGRLYRPALGDILLPQVNLVPAVLFYLLYPIGLVIFAIGPALRGGTILTAFGLGALFGLFTYGTYDLTSHATIRNWSATVTVVDMAWGCLLGGISAAFSYWVVSRLVA
jgi:uncharacterized membrane protein